MLLAQRIPARNYPALSEHYFTFQHPMSTPDDPVIRRSPPSSMSDGEEEDVMSGGGTPPGEEDDGRERKSRTTDQRSRDTSNGCESPTGSCNDDEESRRRAKACRVCGDHATGYNFNVITCESCKAFFRRNALRPKEFKCPYSDDCDINAVSRRFCQKCRLRKCFNVGMKKEWILNDEQLRRRKNSRLNSSGSMDPEPELRASGGRGSGHHHRHGKSKSPKTAAPTPPLKVKTSPPNSARISPPTTTTKTPKGGGAAGRRASVGGSPPKATPPAKSNSPLVSPIPRVPTQREQQKAGMVKNPIITPIPAPPSSHSPVLMNSNHQTSPDANEYDPNIMQIQRQMLQQHVSPTMQRPPPIQQQNTNADEMITMSRQQLEQLIRNAARKGQVPQQNEFFPGSDDFVSPPPKRFAYNSGDSSLGSTGSINYAISDGSDLSGTYNGYTMGTQQPNMITVQASQMNDYPSPQMIPQPQPVYAQQMPQQPHDPPPMTQQQQMAALMQEKFKQKMHDTIHHALNVSSPEAVEGDTLQEIMVGGDPRLNFQLNTDETRRLDAVRDAFMILNEKVEGKSADLLMKGNHNPADIMNIMDITMRRLVKVAKKMPSFNDLSPETKFALLKGGMVEMLTMRGVRRFDMKTKSWRTPVVSEQYHVSFAMFDQLKTDIKDMQKDAFMGIMGSLQDDIRVDELAIDLIVLVVLFDKTRPGVSNPHDIALIEMHREQYLKLLLRYLQSRYGHEATQRYAGFKELLQRLKDIGKHAANLFLGTLNPADAEALPKEFFNIG